MSEIKARDLYATMDTSHPALVAGRVKCETCGAALKVNSSECLRTGWPKCCGYTMTLMPAAAKGEGKS